MQGQLSLDGREVTEIKSKWGDLHLNSLPDGMTREELASLRHGDRVKVICEFVMDKLAFNEGFDRQGIGTRPFSGEIELKTLSTNFYVEGITRKADLEASWLAEHA